METIINIIIALLAFSFVVFFHELCHYLMAKSLKIKAKEFAIGFGKSMVVYQNKKIYFFPSGKNKPYDEDEMSYHLKMLPLGGYVMFDRSKLVDGKAVRDEYLNSFHPFKRILVLLAGPLGNLVLGLGFFFLFFSQQVGVGAPDIVKKVTEDSYAQEVGIKPGDRLIGVNGKQEFDIEDVRQGIKKDHFCITYEQKGKVQEFCEEQTVKRDLFGITMGVPAKDFAKEAVVLYGSLIKEYSTSFAKIIFNLEIKSLNGPIGVIDAVQESVPVWNEFLIMMITINVALGVANLLFPLSITDGGRIVMDLIAWVRGKQSIETKYLDVASVVLMILLFATTTVLDLQRLFDKIGWF